MSINGIAETAASLAAAPPEPRETYATLADTLGHAGADISKLAAAMAVLARRLP